MVNIFDIPEKEDKEERRRLAVALKNYGINDSAIPKILASGYGKLAEEIIRIAFDNGVKVREDRDLAEILSVLEPNSEIPSEVLVVVAEILAYVYKANGTYQAMKNQGTGNEAPEAE